MNYIDLALIFKALSSETRVEIVHLLSEKEMCACKILEKFDITQPTLSHHMKILTECNLILDRRDGKWTYYQINKNLIGKIEAFFKALNMKKISSCGCDC